MKCHVKLSKLVVNNLIQNPAGDIRRTGISVGQEVLVRKALGTLVNTHFMESEGPAKQASSPASVTEESAPEQSLDTQEGQSGSVVLLSAAQNTGCIAEWWHSPNSARRSCPSSCHGL